MKKIDLMEFVGMYVKVIFFDGTSSSGILRYIENCFDGSMYCKPNMFHLNDYVFRASHVTFIKVLNL